MFDVLDEGNTDLLFEQAWELTLKLCLTVSPCKLGHEVRGIQWCRGSKASECWMGDLEAQGQEWKSKNRHKSLCMANMKC